MKGLEFAILPCGSGQNDAAWNFTGYGFATAEKKARQEAWMTFPLPCIVIRHPQAGYIMFDVGCGPGEETDRRPADHRDINPVIIARDEYVDRRLQQMGIGLEEISAIILSHCHWDHIGGLEFFQGKPALQNIYVSREDYAHALVQSHRSAKGYSDTLYYRWNLDVDGADFHLVEEETELFPGVELLRLEGHSPCVLGLMLHLESGTWIFPSDAVTADLCLRDPIVRPGTIYDSLGFDRTVKRLRQLEKKYNARFFFQHDPFTFPKYQTMQWIH